jgi:hypothetical protein
MTKPPDGGRTDAQRDDDASLGYGADVLDDMPGATFQEHDALTEAVTLSVFIEMERESS